MSELPPELLPLLRRAGLLAPGEALHATALAGGVASDIWRLDLAGGAICVKRALPKLKVEAEWRAPVERNAYEVAWLQLAGRIAPGAVPKVLAHDSAAGLFVMEFLDPALYPVWKSELREGRVDLAAARADPCGHGRGCGSRGKLSKRRNLLCDPAGALSRSSGSRASYAGRSPAPAAVRHGRHTPRPRPWGCEPEEYSSRATRTHLPRRGMRLVWRSGFRSRLLSQPSLAEMLVDAARHNGVPAGFRGPGGCLSCGSLVGIPARARSASGASSARTVPGAGRREVARRISCRRARQGESAEGCRPVSPHTGRDVARDRAHLGD